MFGLSWAVIRLIGYSLLAAALIGGAAYVRHEWDAGQAARAQVVARAAQDKAVSRAETVVVHQAQAQETAAQHTLAAQATVIIKRIPVYVSSSPSPPVGCVTWGMLRLHDAAVLGLSPDDLPAASQPDAACSSVAPSAFAATVARNYAAARANAEQLTALQRDIRAQAVAAGAPPVAVSEPPIAVDVPY